MAFDRWDVVVAPFPLVDTPERKPRPILILSNAAFNVANGHFIAAMITTGARTRWPSDHVVADLAACGLPKPSVVRWKIFTLPLAMATRRIGSLGLAERGVVAAAMAGILLV
jgi:mRNA interferase MazF